MPPSESVNDPRPPAIVVANSHLQITLDSATGVVRSVYNKDANLELVAGDEAGEVPWRLQLATLEPELFERRPVLRGKVTGKTEIVLHFLKEVVGGVWSSSFDSFDWYEDSAFAQGTAVDLVWRRDDGIDLRGRVELPVDSRDASFTMRVVNGSEQTVLAVEYPIVDGIQRLGTDSADDYLAHSVDGGFLFRDPYHLFKDPGIVESWKRLRIVENTTPRGYPDEPTPHGGLYRVRAYPNGFEGSPMQFFTYYKRDVGGFYFATHDPHNTEKLFNVFSSEHRAGLTCTFVHYSWDWQPGSGLTLDYPTLIGALSQGTWYEAAERYRDWATSTGEGHPDWCAMGTLRSRVAKGTASKWLVEDVAFNTFGLPISFDISKWLEAFHEVTGKPVFHIVGHDWEGGAVHVPPGKWQKLRDLLAPNRPGPSLYELADVIGVEADTANLGTLRDTQLKLRMDLWDSYHLQPLEYLPPTFEARNVAAIRSCGDYLVPFLWRDFIGYGHDTEEYGTLVPITPFTNAFMCPTTDYWRRWHARTDVELMRAGVDGIYYDVGASCATPTLCMNRKHDHPVGFGRGLVESYEDVLRMSKAAAAEASGGGYVPVGTEVMIENLIGVVDYAQCRAGAGVQATMEGEEFVEWQKDRRAVKIPLFAYVYHEYGPVLLDGCAKLSREFGDVFYEIAARVALEGGLLQLNYEFSPLELFPGMEGPSYQLVYTNQIYEETRPLRVDPEKLEFIREISEARTGFAKDYLAYGTMVANLSYLSAMPSVTLDWDHFNSIHGLRLEAGEYTTDSIVQVAWKDRELKLGFLFVNLLDDTPQVVTVALDPARYGLTGPYSASLKTTQETIDVATFDDETDLAIALSPRRVVLLEVVTADRPG